VCESWEDFEFYECLPVCGVGSSLCNWKNSGLGEDDPKEEKMEECEAIVEPNLQEINVEDVR